MTPSPLWHFSKKSFDLVAAPFPNVGIFKHYFPCCLQYRYSLGADYERHWSPISQWTGKVLSFLQLWPVFEQDLCALVQLRKLFPFAVNACIGYTNKQDAKSKLRKWRFIHSSSIGGCDDHLKCVVESLPEHGSSNFQRRGSNISVKSLKTFECLQISNLHFQRRGFGKQFRTLLKFHSAPICT